MNADLKALVERLREALAVPKVWTEDERDGMSAAFVLANEVKGRGHYESLFAIGAWLLSHRAALVEPVKPVEHHHYSPNDQMQGDCDVCGNRRHVPWHIGEEEEQKP
jgi:hypothetical protein